MSSILQHREVNEIDGVIYEVLTDVEFYDDNLSIETVSTAKENDKTISYSETVSFWSPEQVIELRDMLLKKYPI